MNEGLTYLVDAAQETGFVTLDATAVDALYAALAAVTPRKPARPRNRDAERAITASLHRIADKVVWETGRY